MSAAKKPNPPSIATALALNEAKALRAKKYAEKEKGVREMFAAGVPKKRIEAVLRVSHQYIQKVLARAEVKS